MLVRAKYLDSDDCKLVICPGCSQRGTPHYAGSPDNQAIRFCQRTMFGLCHWLRARGSCSGRRVRPCGPDSSRAKDTAPVLTAAGLGSLCAVALASVSSL